MLIVFYFVRYSLINLLMFYTIIILIFKTEDNYPSSYILLQDIFCSVTYIIDTAL